jgi:hypothetical protein
MKTLYLITLVIRIENDGFVYVYIVMEMLNHLILIPTKVNLRKLTLSSTSPTNNHKWTHMIRKNRQFLKRWPVVLLMLKSSVTLVIRIENDGFVYVYIVMEMLNHLILIPLSNLEPKTLWLINYVKMRFNDFWLPLTKHREFGWDES